MHLIGVPSRPPQKPHHHHVLPLIGQVSYPDHLSSNIAMPEMEVSPLMLPPIHVGVNGSLVNYAMATVELRLSTYQATRLKMLNVVHVPSQ